MVPSYFPQWSHLLLLPMTSIRPPTASVPTAPSSPALILTWRLAWSLICHGLKKWFIYWLLETEEWMGWMGRWYGKWWKFPENWRSRDHLHPERWTGNSSISESQCQIQTTLWASLGWCPRTPLKAFMVAWVWPSWLSKPSPYAHKLQGWACFESLALPILEHSMFSNCCAVSLRGWSLETHSFGQPISV